MNDQEKADLAIDLIYRSKNILSNFADEMKDSPFYQENRTIDQLKFDRCMGLIDVLMEFGLFEHAPDEDWFRDYFLLTGVHAVLTEEGWIPADQNTVEITGEEPMEVLDEVNAP